MYIALSANWHEPYFTSRWGRSLKGEMLIGEIIGWSVKLSTGDTLNSIPRK